MKTPRLPIILLSVLASAFNVAVAQQSLIIRFTDGTNHGSLLSSLNRITFSSGNMILKKADTGIDSYLLSTIGTMTFGIYSDVPNIKTPDNSLAIYPCPATDYVQLKNAPDMEMDIRIFSMDGKVLIITKITGSQPINVSALSRGLYLMKVNNDILKFVKQ